MGHTLILWTVSLLASQVSDGQVIENPADGVGRSCNCQSQAPASRGGPLGLGFLDKLRGTSADEAVPAEPRVPLWVRIPNWFQNRFPGVLGRSDNIASNYENLQMTEENMGGQPHPSVSYAEPPLLPPMQPATVTQAQYRQDPTNNNMVVAGATTAPASNLGVILPKFAGKIGHEPDYTWVTGQLGQQNGQWVIHYGVPGEVDNFGGKLVLNYQGDMRGLQVGDLISVSGGLTAQNGRLGGVYQVNTLSLIERR